MQNKAIVFKLMLYSVSITVLALSSACTTISKTAEEEKTGFVEPASKVLNSGSPKEQVDELNLLYLEAARENDWQQAYRYAKNATEIDPSREEVWINLLSSAHRLKKHEVMEHAFITLCKRFPEAVLTLSSRAVTDIIWRVKDSEDIASSGYVEILGLLFDMGFTLDGDEPSYYWKDLALFHLQENNIERAALVAGKVSLPEVIIGMLSDKRFDRVVWNNKHEFVIMDAARSRNEKLLQLYASQPNKLDGLVRLGYGYIGTQEYQKVIKFSESVLRSTLSKEASRQGAGPVNYIDFGRKIPWILDNYARSLSAIGRYEEAIRVMRYAGTMLEQGHRNVSQNINLALLLCKIGETTESEKALWDVAPSVSAYGEMLIHSVQLCIATQGGDDDKTRSNLDAIIELREESTETYLDALLIGGSIDSAVEAVLEGLEDESTRFDTLLYLQEYALPPVVSPYDQMLYTRIRTLKERTELQEAIKKYGRIAKYDLRRL